MAVLYIARRDASCSWSRRSTRFGAVYGLVLAFCLCYFPTIALTNSITMQQVADPGRDFPPIRMMGTLGWIVINLDRRLHAHRGRRDAVPARRRARAS